MISSIQLGTFPLEAKVCGFSDFASAVNYRPDSLVAANAPPYQRLPPAVSSRVSPRFVFTTIHVNQAHDHQKPTGSKKAVLNSAHLNS